MEKLTKNGLTFFVPCLNEEGNVGVVCEMLITIMREQSFAYEILVVDDNSSDQSVSEVEGIVEKNPTVRLHLIRNSYCRGLGRNYFVAAQRAEMEYFMLVNGDAAEPPEAIRTLLSHKGQADAIIPYLGLNEARTLPRRILSALFTRLVNLLSGHRLKYYNGPVLHRTENVRLWFAETAGFGYQAELLCRLLDEGISIKEVQVSNNDRVMGATKALTFTNILAVSNSLFHIALRRLERLSLRL